MDKTVITPECNILSLTAKEFARWILDNLKRGESVPFALNKLSDTEYENWWFAQIFEAEFDSTFIIIDYCGGGYPTAFAIDGDDDFTIEAIEHYFEHLNDYYNDEEKINIDLNDIRKGGNNNG